jgi:hypothetical protein
MTTVSCALSLRACLVVDNHPARQELAHGLLSRALEAQKIRRGRMGAMWLAILTSQAGRTFAFADGCSFHHTTRSGAWPNDCVQRGRCLPIAGS